MKTVVTGGAGFIGSHLSDALLGEGHEVHVLDNLSSGRSEWVPADAHLHQTDLTGSGIEKLIGQLRPDVVFHHAAQADVQRSIDDPAFDADVNITGTVRLLEACRRHGIRRFVFASTSGVYGDNERPLLSENDAPAPISYYGHSKLTAEGYIRIFNRLYGLPYTIFRYGNVYGPRQTPKGEGGVVAVFMERLRLGQPLGIHGDGEQTRDFIYVGDVVAANLAAAGAAGNGIYHVSTGRGTSIRNLAEQLLSLHGKNIPVRYTQPRPGDIRHSCLDNSKAGSELNWSPRFGIEEGLRETYVSFLGK